MRILRLRISGRVQGVNFRYNVKSYCDKNNIKGKVMNRDDGCVLIVAQGSALELDDLVSWLKGSPGFSKVDSVEVEEIGGEKFDDFKAAEN